MHRCQRPRSQPRRATIPLSRLPANPSAPRVPPCAPLHRGPRSPSLARAGPNLGLDEPISARTPPFVPRASLRLLPLDPELDRRSAAIAPPAGEPTPTSLLPVTSSQLGQGLHGARRLAPACTAGRRHHRKRTPRARICASPPGSAPSHRTPASPRHPTAAMTSCSPGAEEEVERAPLTGHLPRPSPDPPAQEAHGVASSG
ncbi:uncharacterized protein DKFZp434B061-like [Triticum dicoccoides]|uniref:uncharacterized protein DKFZp434B061-like n=1 Tax=Triticum dicoccoides TaxID=85692 RepID=UPI00188FE587|nr:uncharacterized protein DKFZp434B061-like [Triticum dicoccoides]